MRTIWQALAWKEGHEHKWKLVAIAAVLTCAVVFATLNGARDALAIAQWIIVLITMPLALFVGAGAAASEQSRRTAEFLAALPVESWKVAVWKLIAGATSLCLAIAAAVLVLFLIWWKSADWGYDLDQMVTYAYRDFPPNIRVGNWFQSAALSAMAIALSVYLWSAAAGMNRVDEVSAGAKALLIMLVWWGALVLIGVRLDSEWFQGAGRKVLVTVVAASPAGVAVQSPDAHAASWWANSSVPGFLGYSFHFILAAWFITHFGRLKMRARRGASTGLDAESLVGWLGGPWQSTIGTVAWKQLRESGPVVLAGIGAALVFTILFAVVQWKEISGRPVAILELLAGMIATFAVFVTLVVGVGASLTDLSPSLNSFWRSRPINPHTWFWTKFLTGFSLLIFTLLLPIYLLAGIAHAAYASQLWDSLWSLSILSTIGIVASLYVTSMAMTCLVRQPIYGAILGIGALFVGPIAVESLLKLIQLLRGPDEAGLLSNWQESVLISSSIAVVAVASLVLGWLATANDWGRRSRY